MCLGMPKSAGEIPACAFYEHQCRSVLRESDILGRVGGEEFAVTVIEDSLPKAVKVAERIREEIEAFSVRFDGEVIRCTVSLGVAEFQETDIDAGGLLKRADEALYEAKEGGRNQVRTSG